LTKPEGKRQLGRPRHKWQDLKTDLQEITEGVDWIDLAQEKGKWRALLNKEVNLGAPYNPGNFLTRSGAISFQRGLCFMDLVTAVRPTNLTQAPNHLNYG